MEKPTSPRERPKVLGKMYVPNFLAIIIISYLFLHMLVTYHWKYLNKSYNCVLEALQLEFKWKSYDHTKFWTHLLRKEHGCSLGKHDLSCSLKEQMCSKLCVIITFAVEFWFKCFQVQSCNSPWDLSNDSLQNYIKINMRWLWLLKDSKLTP
jgi:hypothetical protein